MRPTIEVLASAFLDDSSGRPFKVCVEVDKILNIDHACAPDHAVLDLEEHQYETLWVQDTVPQLYAKINLAMQLTK